MRKSVNRIRAALPYKPPDTRVEYVWIDMGLDGLTVLVGPNASGKTTVLESLGYTVSGLLKITAGILGIALTSTLRPRKGVPIPMVGNVLLGESRVSSAYVEPMHPLDFEAKRKTWSMARHVLGNEAPLLLREIENDINRSEVLRLEEVIEKLPRGSLLMGERRKEFYHLLTELITEILGQDVDVLVGRLLRRGAFFAVGKGHLVRHILLYKPQVRILYNLGEGEVMDKALLLESIGGIAIVRRKNSEVIKGPRILVFHPGFVYLRGTFEGLYRMYVKDMREGLPNEKESLSILRKYLDWVEGYELISNELHLKDRYGRGVSVYDLSDGHRVAVFMGLLYAISKPPSLILVDTPESFVHPDGLPVIADFLVNLVAKDNQVVVATQSMEFLNELLVRARQYGVLDHTSVQKVGLSSEGSVRVTGKWSGDVGLRSIEELGADLRR